MSGRDEPYPFPMETVELTIHARLFPDGPVYTGTISRAFSDADNLPCILESPLRSTLADLISRLR